MRLKSVRLLAAAITTVAVAGCSGYKDPTIVITGATVGEATDEALTLNLAADLTNPNDQPLELLTFEYRVEVDGKPVYRGKRAAQATLAAGDHRTVMIPAVVPYEAMGWSAGALPAAAAYSVRGNLQYITPGEIAQILFDSGVRKPRAGFRGQGQASLAVEG